MTYMSDTQLISFLLCSRNHEYWLKRAAKRATAQQAADEANAEYFAQLRASQRLNSTFRQFHHPSSLPRSQVEANHGVITARPLNPSLVDTSYRHFDGFNASQSQRYYEPPCDVSALRVLQGDAAAEHADIPLQATERPVRSFQRVTPTSSPTLRTHAPPVYSPTRSTQLEPTERFEYYNAPQAKSNGWMPEEASYQTTSTASSSSSYRPSSSYKFQSPTAKLNSSLSSSPLPMTTLRSPTTPIDRSLTYRPQLSNSRSSPSIKANVLLDIAAAPDRYQKRANEWQGGKYEQVLQL